MELVNAAAKLLEGYGYTLRDGDAELLSFCVGRVSDYIKNECNISDIPDGLARLAAQRAVGEFLGAKLAFNSGDVIGVDAERVVKSVSVGDTSTSFEVGKTPRERLTAAAELLKRSGEGELACYRKIRW